MSITCRGNKDLVLACPSVRPSVRNAYIRSKSFRDRISKFYICIHTHVEQAWNKRNPYIFFSVGLVLAEFWLFFFFFFFLIFFLLVHCISLCNLVNKISGEPFEL